jgi:hypothetical protein
MVSLFGGVGDKTGRSAWLWWCGSLVAALWLLWPIRYALVAVETHHRAGVPSGAVERTVPARIR